MKLLCLILTFASMVAACTPRYFRPPLDIEETYTSQARPTVAHIKQALADCGFSRPLQRIGSESFDNARARVNECMFLRGFYFKSGDGGYCSVPMYRATLPACIDAPIRPTEGYYNQPIGSEEKAQLDRQMQKQIAQYKATVATRVRLPLLLDVAFNNPNRYGNGTALQDADQCSLIFKRKEIDTPSIEPKNAAEAIECMLNKGYTFADEKYVCNRPNWRDEIKVCANYAIAYADDQKRAYDTITTQSWPYESFEFMNPAKKVMSEVRQDEKSCKKELYESPDWRNLRAQSIECMLEKGYVLTESNAQRLCRNVDYKNRLRICLDALK